jgi:hypothetical protein
MSEHEDHVHVEPEVAADDTTNGRPPGSLAERMAHRAGELEQTVSAIFPIPTWEEVLAVELRLVGWESLRRVAQKHERQRVDAIKELYVAADQILVATEGFFEIAESQRTRIESTWQELARLTGRKLPEDLTPRRALISLVGDTNVAILWADWQQWMTTRRPDVDEEVGKDFGTTQ